MNFFSSSFLHQNLFSANFFSSIVFLPSTPPLSAATDFADFVNFANFTVFADFVNFADFNSINGLKWAEGEWGEGEWGEGQAG